MAKRNYIYGRNAAIEALLAGDSLEKIYIASGASGEPINKIYSLAKKTGVPCSRFDKRKFADLEKRSGAGRNKSQGVVALASPVEYLSVEGLADSAFSREDKPLIVALDGVSDPQNFGAIARSAECGGAAGLIIPTRNSAPLSPAAMKASAGALERLDLAKAESLSGALEYLKERDFWIIGSDCAAERNYFENLYDRAVCLVVGSEGDGIGGQVRAICDFFVKIPLVGAIESLNASVSAGIIIFEILRQKITSQ